MSYYFWLGAEAEEISYREMAQMIALLPSIDPPLSFKRPETLAEHYGHDD